MLKSKFDMKEVLQCAKKGDELAREQLILHYKPYIINVAGHICGRFVTWSDEESSIALLAFNKAIDTYVEEKERKFLSYVYLLINRDLIDFFRKENKETTNLSLNAIEEQQKAIELEHASSIEQYEQQLETTELVEEILELDVALQKFNITFEELEDHSPKHKDTRQTLFEMAESITKEKECITLLMEKKKLPIASIIKKLGYKKKMLERHRKYLITLILLCLNPQWVKLKNYIKKEGS